MVETTHAVGHTPTSRTPESLLIRHQINRPQSQAIMAQPKHEIEVVAAETSASLVGEVEPHWTAKAMADARSIEPEVPEEAIIALMSPKTWVQEGNPTVMESVPPRRRHRRRR